MPRLAPLRALLVLVCGMLALTGCVSSTVSGNTPPEIEYVETEPPQNHWPDSPYSTQQPGEPEGCLFGVCSEPEPEPCSLLTEVCPRGEQQEACLIKGNISYYTGERIYHLPGQEYYEETVINETAGERWFCSEEEAVAAGWRRSML